MSATVGDRGTSAHQFADVGDALTRAVADEDWQQVGELIRDHWVTLVCEHWELVRATLRTLPSEVVNADPALRAGQAVFVELGAGLASRSAPIPSQPDALDALGCSAAAFDTLAVGTAQAMVLRLGGRFREAAEMCARMARVAAAALEAQPDAVKGTLPLFRLQWAVTHQLAGDHGESTAAYRMAFRAGDGFGIDFVARNAAGGLALDHVVVGDVSKAAEWVAEERRYGPAPEWIDFRVRVSGLVASALVAIEGADAEGARAALATLGDVLDTEELWAFSTYAHCQLALLEGNPAAGLDRIERETQVHSRWYTDGSAAVELLTDVATELHCALGNGNEALAEASAASDRVQRRTRARVALLADDPAVALSEATVLAASEGMSTRVVLDALMIEVSAAVALGRPDVAERSLRRAVSLAAMAGAVRPFLALTAQAREWLGGTDLEALVRELGVDVGSASRFFPEELRKVALTNRELAVLRELASGRRVGAIAERMFVSHNTLKSQIRSLYRKLGVHSRSGALEVAGRLRLL